MKTLSMNKNNSQNKENKPIQTLPPQKISVEEILDMLNPSKIYQKAKSESEEISTSEKYKTELCRNWQQGDCNFGSTCKFAHGQRELQTDCAINEKYKSKQCQLFHEDGHCPYGTRCHFIHTKPEEVTRTYLNQLQDITNIPQMERLLVFQKFSL